MFPILVSLTLLFLLIVSAFPGWGWNQKWGYGPSVVLSLIFVAVIILLILGYIPYRSYLLGSAYNQLRLDR